MKFVPNKYFLPDDSFETNELLKNFSFSSEDMKKTQIEIINNFKTSDYIDYSPLKKEQPVTNYDTLLLPHTPKKTKEFVSLRVNDPDLDNILEDLEYICFVQKDYTTSQKIIDDILQHHEKNLTMGEYIHIILSKALILYQKKERTKVYDQLLLIEPYLHYFNHEQLVGFYDFKGNIFLFAGEETNNTAFLTIALKSFQKTITLADQSPLHPDIYQKTQFKIAKIYFYTHQDQQAIDIFREIIDMPDSLFDGDEMAFRTNKEIKNKSREILGMLAEKGGE